MFICTIRKQIKTFLSFASTSPRRFRYQYIAPLHASAGSFTVHKASLGLSAEAAEILDNIQFLTTAITFANSPSSKIQCTASWFHNQIQSTPKPQITPTSTPEDLITASIRLTALIYTRSIAMKTPISQTFHQPQLEELYVSVFRLGFARWKRIPGIFLWIMLTSCSVGEVRPEGRKLQFKLALTGVAIACVSFDCIHAYLKAFWSVQRWIARERETIEDILGEMHKAQECVAM